MARSFTMAAGILLVMAVSAVAAATAGAALATLWNQPLLLYQYMPLCVNSARPMHQSVFAWSTDNFCSRSVPPSRDFDRLASMFSREMCHTLDYSTYTMRAGRETALCPSVLNIGWCLSIYMRLMLSITLPHSKRPAAHERRPVPGYPPGQLPASCFIGSVSHSFKSTPSGPIQSLLETARRCSVASCRSCQMSDIARKDYIICRDICIFM